MSGVTLEDLIAGRFPTALDKQGTGGVRVAVRGLYVLSVRSESDGDWHVAVADGKVSVFITEITPSYQASLGKPSVGSTIDEMGVPFCDTVHQSESWHGNTCWEIHPVTAWALSSAAATITTTTKAGQEFNVTITYAQDPITRGSIQNITVYIFDSDGPVVNEAVYIHVTYASGETTDYLCLTMSNGACSYAWRIGGNSTPGTFLVRVTVEGVEFDSSFQVNPA